MSIRTPQRISRALRNSRKHVSTILVMSFFGGSMTHYTSFVLSGLVTLSE